MIHGTPSGPDTVVVSGPDSCSRGLVGKMRA